MRKIIQWVLAANLVCGASVFTACSSDNSDNPANNSLAQKIQGKWMVAETNGKPEWDLGWMWTICNRMDGKRSDFILHVTPETLKAHWNIFLAAYLGTDDKATIGQYTRRLMAYYAVRLPYMVDLQVQGRLPEDALQQLPKVIG